MTYRIVEPDGKTVVEIPCDEKFAAQRWALDWASSKAVADEYLIKQDEGDFAKIFHTRGGQWYLMNA